MHVWHHELRQTIFTNIKRNYGRLNHVFEEDLQNVDCPWIYRAEDALLQDRGEDLGVGHATAVARRHEMMATENECPSNVYQRVQD